MDTNLMNKNLLDYYVNHKTESWTMSVPFHAPVEKIRSKRTTKPTDWKGMTNKFNDHEFRTDLQLNDALSLIDNGATWAMAIMPKKGDAHFISAKYVGMDFEQHKVHCPEPPSIEASLEKAFNEGILPLFYYNTFSYTEESPRFRMIWELDEPIADAGDFGMVLRYFINLFNTDRSCKDPSRFFAGGNDHLMVLQNHSTISKTTIVERAYEWEKNSKSPNKYKGKRGKKKVSQSDTTDVDQVDEDWQKKIRSVNYELLSSRCKLWDEAINKRGLDAHWCYYNQLFHLALTAHRMEGGEKRIRAAIRENPQYYNNDTHDVDYYLDCISDIKKGCSHEERCSADVCPFFDECCNPGFITDYRYVYAITHYNYVEPPRIMPEEGQRQLSEIFALALASEQNGLHMRNAQTGLGKTEMLLTYDYAGDSTLIAVQTHYNIEEVGGRAKSIGLTNFICQEEIKYRAEDVERVKALHRAGLSAKDIKPLNTGNMAELLSGKYKLAIVTQDCLFNHFADFAAVYKNIICDEDIKNRFYQTVSVPCSEIRKTLLDMNFLGLIQLREEHNEWLAMIGEAKQDTPLPPLPPLCINTGLMLEKMYDNLPPFDISQLMHPFSTLTKSGESNRRNGRGGSISYTMTRPLPKSKIIVLSATIKESAYRILFKDTFIDYKEVEPVQMRGTIIFDTRETFSADKISKNTVAKTMGELEIRHSELSEKEFVVITFGKFGKKVRSLGYTVHDSTYFYNTAGKDNLKGKNILVFGTSRLPANAIISMARAAGYTPTSTAMKTRRLRRYGEEFDFYGFEDETLNDLLLWEIESEMTQSIGRARPLREDCTVLVAGFPPERY